MPRRVARGGPARGPLVLMPALMAAGIALTVIDTKVVLEALFGIKSAFARTPWRWKRSRVAPRRPSLPQEFLRADPATGVFCNNRFLEETAEAWKNELRSGWR